MRVVGVDLELRFSTRGWLPKFISTQSKPRFLFQVFVHCYRFYPAVVHYCEKRLEPSHKKRDYVSAFCLKYLVARLMRLVLEEKRLKA